ncbi:MAG: transcription-repair coupling factor [Anaerolineaceae bacterium]|nr:transcription-repair coupling factor [Anaerolineaceae bacterium]
MMDAVGDCCRAGEQVIIVSRQSPRLQALWKDRESFLELKSTPGFVEGVLTEGWTLSSPETVTTHLFTDSEIFGWDRPRPRQKRMEVAEAPEASYADLKPGDWVVHVDHGIGCFAGLVTRTMDGVEREYLRIDYDQGDQLFVPVHQADRLSRYVGSDGGKPRLTRLGTGEWSTATSRTREAVLEIARDLLDLYAKRQVASGYAFAGDTPWQQEMEASFPYIETDDQLRSIASIKHDMENPRPMDRLLCGDVGYGKTEVALRAAFKAVMDGKQVAFLVPTTVLAQQHYETFRQRLVAYPVEVEMLSRFRTPRQQDEILKRMRNGAVDIVIGTHRLIQNDVAFKDLGLVVIDEEQRFGVTHKEHLKHLREEVDVLTMTATPIPRTLYMALTGVRDISMIATPPEERLPVITHIGPYSKRLIRQAILRELERGGQIFFVHNRVQTIEAMCRHLNRLVPEARIGIGHGQLPEKDLSQVMKVFTKGDIDVLLCTSIIESGLDIPNANTLIVDRADTFGLAQLYQLRGRVGRGAQRAYACFFRHKSKSATLQGLERLEVIAENTQLGAGYSIAMRDLEMRGAGEFLGTRQHGYIASVGFHLYTRLLGQAVRDLRRAQGLETDQEDDMLRKDLRMPVSVELPTSVGIPLFYVPEQHLRLQLYRRLADMQTEDEVHALGEEFQDRFGPLPAQTRELLYQMQVKLRGERIGLASISMEGDQIVLRFPPLPKGIKSRHLPEIGWRTRTGRNGYRILIKEYDDWQQLLLEVLSEICTAMGK